MSPDLAAAAVPWCRLLTGTLQSCVRPVTATGHGNEVSCLGLKPRGHLEGEQSTSVKLRSEGPSQRVLMGSLKEVCPQVL